MKCHANDNTVVKLTGFLVISLTETPSCLQTSGSQITNKREKSFVRADQMSTQFRLLLTKCFKEVHKQVMKTVAFHRNSEEARLLSSDLVLEFAGLNEEQVCGPLYLSYESQGIREP